MNLTRLHGAVLLTLAFACGGDDKGSLEAGVGGNREGCGEPGSHSVALAEHSCECESGYDWCSEAIDDFNCCAIESADTGETDGEDPELGDPPSEPCNADAAERLVCLADPDAPEDPGAATVWACNGERWVVVPSYSTFACMAAGFPFAYGCAPGPSEPTFLCGFGQGSSCEAEQYTGLCVDEDIIDSCVWGRRTVDRCSRLCAELGVFGPGYVGGACTQPDPELPAVCVCCTDC